jgi:hypothetical protein
MNTPPNFMLVFVVPVAQSPAPAYQPTEASIAATRREMGKQGLSKLLTSRPKLTASQRRDLEVKANAKRWGHPVR